MTQIAKKKTYMGHLKYGKIHEEKYAYIDPKCKENIFEFLFWKIKVS